MTETEAPADISPDTETEIEVEAAATDVAAPTTPAAEAHFPKAINRDEEPSIIHYAPKAHEALDPSKRFKE